MKLDFPARLVDGRLPRVVSEAIARALRIAWNKPVVVTVKEVKRKRSRDQNAYYWACVVPAITEMFRDAGNDADCDDVHQFLKLYVGKLSNTFGLPDGELVKSVGSSAKLSKQEFSDYLEKCIAFAAQFDVIIPPPDQFYQSHQQE